MKQLICKMCGSTELKKEKGVIHCLICGAKYSADETQDEKDNKTLQNARMAFDQKNWDDVIKYYTILKDNNPANIEAVFYSAFGKYMQDFIQNHSLLKNTVAGLINNYSVERDIDFQAIFTKINNDLINLYNDTDIEEDIELRKSINDICTSLILTMDDIVTKYLDDKKDSALVYLKLMFNQASHIHYLGDVLKDISDRIKKLDLSFEPDLSYLAENIQKLDLTSKPRIEYLHWEEFSGYFTVLKEMNPNSIDFEFCCELGNFVLCGLNHANCREKHNPELMNEIESHYNAIKELLPTYCKNTAERNDFDEIERLGSIILHIKQYKNSFDCDRSFEFRENDEDSQISEMVDSIVCTYFEQIEEIEASLPENSKENKMLCLKQMLFCAIAVLSDDCGAIAAILEKIEDTRDDEEFFAAEICCLSLTDNFEKILQESIFKKSLAISTLQENIAAIPSCYTEEKEEYKFLEILEILTKAFISLKNTPLRQALINKPISHKKILSSLYDMWNDFSGIYPKKSEMYQESICNRIKEIDNSSSLGKTIELFEESIFIAIHVARSLFKSDSKFLFVMLAMFTGFLGIHNFFAGYKKAGIIKIIISLTIIGIYVSWIWALVDIFTTKNKKDGTPLK